MFKCHIFINEIWHKKSRFSSICQCHFHIYISAYYCSNDINSLCSGASMSTFVSWLVGLSKKCKKCKKWGIQPMSANINYSNGGIDLRTFYTWFFLYLCPSDCFLLNSWKNVQKALGLCTVVIAYDPDSTIHRALYGCSHACLLLEQK